MIAPLGSRSERERGVVHDLRALEECGFVTTAGQTKDPRLQAAGTRMARPKTSSLFQSTA